MVTKSLVEVPFSVHGLIFIESVRGPLKGEYIFYRKLIKKKRNVVCGS